MHLPLIALPIAGLFSDIGAIVLGGAYFVGRTAYTIAYMRLGPKYRTPGYLIASLSLLGLLILAVLAVIEMQMGESLT